MKAVFENIFYLIIPYFARRIKIFINKLTIYIKNKQYSFCFACSSHDNRNVCWLRRPLLKKRRLQKRQPLQRKKRLPDVIHCATGREAGLTETLTKEKGLLALTDVMDMTVPGEDVKVKDKIVPGFLDTLATNPYGDGVTYYAPMFYGPCGLFHDAGLLEEKGWTLPTTWDEMCELGETAKAEGISLFTYPTTGYFDAFMYALLSSAGGPEFFDKCMTYEEGIWESEDARKVFDIVAKLAEYTEPTTVANANNESFTKNQQLILDNKAIFCPNGA